MKNRKPYLHMSDIEKQNTPLPNEVTPEDAFTKLAFVALQVTDQYKLKTLKLDVKTDKK